MSRITALHQLGQSIWYDNIERRLLDNGEMARMIARGDIRGVTSNPSIFNNAISKSTDYDAALLPMAWAGWPAEQIFYQLAVEDIRRAADLFAGLYQESNRGDGYVSLEVSPYLAHDTQGTIAEAKKLWQWVNRPNLMIKIPATIEGIPAISAVIAAGINVNVTLIFSLERYGQVMDAFLRGLERRVAQGQPISSIASVASFFVSRVDSKVDAQLGQIIQAGGSLVNPASALLGKAAIANARLAYAQFTEVFTSPRYQALKQHGARLQRPLWASTSTKNPKYRDVIYVEELIGPDTVNTVPPQTLDGFRDHGEARLSLSENLAHAHLALEGLAQIGIDMLAVTDALEQEGVKAFADAFTALLGSIEKRRTEASAMLGKLQPGVAAGVAELDRQNIAARIWQGDASVWTANQKGQEEIHRRLGWLNSPVESQSHISELTEFAAQIRQAGYRKVLLLGMGGSSLAPEVLHTIFGVAPAGVDGLPNLDLAILDSTDPRQVASAARWADLDDTLFIVSSKSGSTVEIKAFLDFFWDAVSKELDAGAGDHFIAITDPGTSLESLAKARGFRHIFAGNPQVGGRYSVMTVFGLVPAALLGIDLSRLLASAQTIQDQCGTTYPAGRNPGLVLGAIMGQAALQGCDKLTLVADPELASFGAWLEQLIAESSGKEGKGIIPVDGEAVMPVKTYGSDRLFVQLRFSGKTDVLATRLRRQGHPVVTFSLQDRSGLGGEMYRWMFATAVACAVLGVNAFDQPDVQDSKTRTVEKIGAFLKAGKLDEGMPFFSAEEGAAFGLEVIPTAEPASLKNILDAFLHQAVPGDFVAINAYLPRNRRTAASLNRLRKAIQAHTCLATTLGFGPRFLHSTGQLHKGGGQNALFIQITDDPTQNLAVPGEIYSFKVLERAQALGDFEALLARSKRTLRLHLRIATLEDLI